MPGHTRHISTHHITKNERRTLIVASVAALACVVVLGAMAAAWASLPHQLTLTVDGATVHIPSGSSVGDLTRMGYLQSARGDILSVKGGVALANAGGEPTLIRNGRLASSAQPLYDGDVVVSNRGADVRERTVIATAAIPAETRYVGTGSIMTVSRSGSPGVLRTVKGELSGSVVETQVVVPPRSSIVVRHQPRPGKKIVALTFDDGPWPISTLAIVRTLQQYDVPATFFMVGTSAARRPGIARKVAESGMVVGSHSLSHKQLPRMPARVVRREVDFGTKRIGKITNTNPRWFRSPYGMTNPAVLREVRAEKLKLAGWNVDSRDWQRPGVKRIVRNVVSATRPGSIILMHDGGGDRSQTVRALPFIIRQLKARGYTFVTLDQMVAASR